MNIKSLVTALFIGLISIHAQAAYVGIHAAAAEGNVALLKEYLDQDPNLLSARNGPNRTPLCIAAMCGQTNAVEFLLSCGADVNDRGFEQLTPLADMAMYGTRDDQKCAAVAAILIAHGADINPVDAFRVTPLLHAVEFKKTKLARILLEHGASLTPTYVGVNSKMTALHMAITDKDIETVKVLLEFKAPLDLTNRDGATPLMHAEQRDLTEIAALLRQAASAATQGASDEPPPTRAAMRAPSRRIADGEDKAFDELVAVAEKLYQGIDYQKEHARIMLNLNRMMTAFTALGEEAGQRNEKAMQAIKKSMEEKRLKSFAPHALGVAAAGGNSEALDMLLNNQQSDFAVNSALCLPVKANVELAVDRFVTWLESDNPYKTGRGEMLEVTDALAGAAAKGNLKAKTALEKFAAAHPEEHLLH